LEVADLRNERILMLARGFQTRELFEEACQGAHVQLHIRLESRSPQSLVALGHGIAILPSVARFDRSRIAIVGMLHRAA
jgi:DNA-binding transcriptional LysR family regulator